MNEPKLCSKLVRFRAENGKIVDVNAVYEDSLPRGSSIGTVVAFHGSPGSHKDFKYIRRILDDIGIRFIGVNYPGFKETDGYKGQQHVNEERQSYTNALIEELRLDGKIVFMGHSRGCENALITATSRHADGLVMINPLGLRRHKAIRPLSRLQGVESAYDLLPKFLGDAMISKLYESIGMRVQDGEEGINSLRSVIRCGIEKQLPYIHKLGEQETKHFLIFSGKDFIIEPEIVFEVLKEYKGLTHFNFDDEIRKPEDVEKILNTFSDGKGASVFVAKDTHYQNKLRADLVADVVQKIFEVTPDSFKNKL